MSARTPFEVHLFFKDPSSVSLSDQDMAKLMVIQHPFLFSYNKLLINFLISQELQSSLIFRLEHNKRKANELRENIETLWERLDIEQDVREIFTIKNKGHAPSTIKSVNKFTYTLYPFL